MKFNRKQLLALILIASTILLGLAAVYIGIKLGEEPTVTPELIEALDGPDGIKYTYSPACANLISIENGTVCIEVPTDMWEGMNDFIDKHWCDSVTWLSEGCNCPSSGSCDQVHEMADGSVYQKGLYTPSDAQCMCSDGYTQIKACSQSDANINCAVNIFSNAPLVTKVCLDRVPDNRSRTYCGLQQIDFETDDAAYTSCFLSGLLADVPECQELPTTIPADFSCGDFGCTTDEQCDEGDGLEYECDESSEDWPNNNQCIQLTCPEGQVLDETTAWPCDCVATTTLTPTPSLTITPSITISYTPTTSVTPTITRTSTPSPSPTRTPSYPPTITVTQLPPTALVSNEIDLVIIGLMMIFTGLYIYRSGIYLSLGQLYWDKGGKNFTGNLMDINDNVKDGFKTLRRGIAIIDKNISKFFTNIKLTINFIFKYSKIFFNSIKDRLILLVLKSLQSVKKDPKKRFEDEVISKQQEKEE